MRFFLYAAMIVPLIGCVTENYAPVNTAWSVSDEKPGKYAVQEGETLYAIAWRYDMDYRSLAKVNHLSPPYELRVGQVLSLKVPSEPKSVAKPSKVPVKVLPAKQSVYKTPVKNAQKIQWMWPAKGNIVAKYSPSSGQKGIDIAGTLGESIYAAASGKVAYCGNGLRGYGNLIIIKHNDEFLSAYAHNQTLLVHEGQQVKKGQKIATMGNTESKRVMLHFEIREAGKSVNPLMYIKP